MPNTEFKTMTADEIIKILQNASEPLLDPEESWHWPTEPDSHWFDIEPILVAKPEKKPEPKKKPSRGYL